MLSLLNLLPVIVCSPPSILRDRCLDAFLFSSFQLLLYLEVFGFITFVWYLCHF